MENELIKFPLFSSLEVNDLVILRPFLKLKHVNKGQILFTEGQIGSNVYFVISGQIKLSKASNQIEHIVDWCGPYQNFAEILLLDSGPYPTMAEAVEDSVLIVLNNSSMPLIFEENPKLAMALIRTLSKKLRLTQEFVRILTTRSKAGILANLLLRLASTGLDLNSPIGIDESLTHKELANMIGTSREVVSRTINQWKKMGILEINNKRLEIIKPHELVDWP